MDLDDPYLLEILGEPGRIRSWMLRHTWSWMLIGLPLGALLGVVLILTWGAAFSGSIGVLVGLALGCWIWIKTVLR